MATKAVSAVATTGQRMTAAAGTSSMRATLGGHMQRQAQSTSAQSRLAPSSSSSSSSRPHRYTGKVSGTQTVLPRPPLGAQLTPQTILAHFAQGPFAPVASLDLLGNNAELATRAMTHESYRNAVEGHNRRLAFIGRRSLKLFTTLYLHAQLQASQSFATTMYVQDLLTSSTKIDECLTTPKLGEQVGQSLQLEKVMRWTPATVLDDVASRESGLLKIRGVCLEALLGAVYHQRGAQIANQFFNTCILPHIVHSLLPKPVPASIAQQFAKPT